jgi:hypothetical protein
MLRLGSLVYNHFGCRALLRGRLRLYAIDATALIEDTGILCVRWCRLEAAKVEFAASWKRWLEWAKLDEVA